jgi:protein-S-isoprenylcysteine O-methyltransferase Ste14
MELNVNIPFAAFLSIFIVRNAVESFIKPKAVRKVSKDGKVSLLILSIAYIVSCASVGFLLLKNGRMNLWIFVSGVVLIGIAYIGRVVALKTIGSSYSQSITPISNSPLVTSGMYSTVRHPLYMFYIVEMLGLLLLKVNALSLLALVLVIGAAVYRVEKEERLLLEAFGGTFAEYKRATNKLIPYLY